MGDKRQSILESVVVVLLVILLIASVIALGVWSLLRLPPK